MAGEVEDFSADALVSQLLLLDSQDPTKDIKLFINSPGEKPTSTVRIVLKRYSSYDVKPGMSALVIN